MPSGISDVAFKIKEEMEVKRADKWSRDRQNNDGWNALVPEV